MNICYIHRYQIFHIINPVKSVKKTKQNCDSTARSITCICKGYKGNFISKRSLCKELPSPDPHPQPASPAASQPPTPAAPFPSVIRARRLTGHLVFQRKNKKLKRFFCLLFFFQAFLSACGNILITIREMTTQSLDIIERLGVFLDALTGLRAWIWKHVIFIGIYFAVKIMRNIFSRVISV